MSKSDARRPWTRLRCYRGGRCVGAALGLAALACLGCGYDSNTQSSSIAGYQWRSIFPSDIRTVAVPVFTSKSYERGVEFELTNAVIHQIEAFTPYKVVPRERADTILEGEIISTQIKPLSFSQESATPQEQSLTVAIDFTWKDLHTGRILVERRDYEQSASFFPTLGEDQFIGEESASQGLAAGIVHEMEAPW